MSSSEITSFKVAHPASGKGAGLTFALYALRYRLRARTGIRLRAGESANLLRGSFGKLLYQEDSAAYQRYFAPSTAAGPSGLRDSPRPFVLRAAHLDGAMLTAGDEFEIGINLFEIKDPPLDLFRRVAAALLPADLLRVDGEQLITLSLEPAPAAVRRIRIRFLTPTELKSAESPDFAALFARLRDRVSTLRALYGAGPLEIDFKAMGERARHIAMIRRDLQRIDTERESRSTGQRHSLGGFIGVAEYEGELSEFIPYLEAARYTGVGRQTVWGKGEIVTEIL
ncbi:MAG TPA: CRISPR system precrRNA processing endoribonuclease RAMP protein Cas6 [Bryobacteraceae bacterium]